MRPVKQVIIIRRSYVNKKGEKVQLRRGKEIAQGAHASMAWLSERIRVCGQGPLQLHEAEQLWLSGLFTKIVLQVQTEDELRYVHSRALTSGLETRLIIDSGATEFDGVPTPTAVGIGPDFADLIDAVTPKELYKLY